MKYHLASLSICLFLGVHAFSAAAKMPNIVFILADDLGAHDVGCYGSTFHKTPHIDSIARRGVKFTQAYAASPLCSPTRSSILAGVYPARSGITSPACHLPEIQLEKKLSKAVPAMRATNADSITRMKPDYFTLPEALREAGYATAHFGKWHLGFNRDANDHFEPKDQGFDQDYPHTPGASGPGGGGYLAPWKFIKDPGITGNPGEHIEDRMSEEAARFIRAHKDQPIFVNYWAYSVHSPWNARRDYIDEFQKTANAKNPQHNPLYAAMVRSLDDGVGKLLKAIDEAGVADNTIIIFTSDNGGWSYLPRTTDPEGFSDMPATSNLPQRSGKASIYEGGTLVPMIVVWPENTKPGTANDALFQSTDFYPTLLAMCGIKPRADVKLDGYDQSRTLLGEPSPRDLVFCHFPHGTPGQTKEIPGFLPSTYVRNADWKLIRFYADNDDGSDRLELYDLKNDEGETKNLAAEKPEIVAELNELISGFLKDTDAVVPVHNPKFSSTAIKKPGPGGKRKPGKTNDAEFPGLEGLKARGFTYTIKDGIVTATPSNKTPFLGIGSAISGPATFKFRARCAKNGEAGIECLKPGTGNKDGQTQSVAYTLKGEDWQEVSVIIPAEGALGVLRFHLPAQSGPVEIDWVELQGASAKRRWDF